ncbi:MULTISPECIES: AraC family transcriptional regulator [Pseudomonas]|uniref:AraC family transcriptional regulator n=1 Tax=Pseudomonas wuhanensis TaxID=2954098 RepID=A0ABY9H062_9PSED|nr:MULTISPECIES: AraC family transcriptional regulator [unclassified Pseudomonas]WLI15634.1 AraC family transcriptional regulator [Pseudomonas sp. FP603]WLI21422.1 AraC family transcriptional regulator [Pseudomonas sp. FP607]
MNHDNFKSCPARRDRAETFLLSTTKDVFFESVRRAYPTVSVELPDSNACDSRIRARMADRFPIAHVRTGNIIVEALARTAADQGMGKFYKLVWQLGGSAWFENAAGRTEICAGQAMIVPFSSSYRLQSGTNYNALTVVFGIDQMPRWKGLAAELSGRPLMLNDAFNAAAAGLGSLFHAKGDARSASRVVEHAVNLVFHTLLDSLDGTPLAPTHGSARLARARVLVEQHLDDGGYSISQFAEALGLSRRSLYQMFRDHDMTPAGFIKQIRLEHARHDVLLVGVDAPSLTEVALRNGFSDSASFSRAFRNAFGVAPSVLRAAH